MSTETENQEQNTEETTSVDDLTLDSINMGGDDEEVSDDSQESDDNQSEEADENTDDNQEESSSDESSEEQSEQSDDGGASDDDSQNTNDEEEEGSEDDQQEDDQDEEVFNALTEETGVQISSYDDLVDQLKKLKTFEDGQGESNLSPMIQKAIEVENAGGNLAQYFARAGMDFDKMDDKEVLRQKFFKDESKLHAENPKLAQMKFDKLYQEKYGSWVKFSGLSAQEDKDDFVEENGQDSIDYDKMMLENDVKNAKSELNKWKDEIETDSKKTDNDASVGGLSEEEAKQIAENYKSNADKALAEFTGTAIPMGEGQDDFALGLNDKTTPIIKQWVDDPAIFLADLGFNGKEIDVNRLLPAMTLIAEASVGNLGGLIAKHSKDLDDVETLEQKIKKPTGKTTPAIPQDRDGGDEWDKIGDAAVAARESRQAS